MEAMAAILKTIQDILIFGLTNDWLIIKHLIVHGSMPMHLLPTNGDVTLFWFANYWLIAIGCLVIALISLLCGYRKTALVFFIIGVVMIFLGLYKIQKQNNQLKEDAKFNTLINAINDRNQR